MHFYYVDLINRFKEELAAMTEAETKHHHDQLDKLYARERENYKRYESALQRCRELLGKAMPSLSGDVLKEAEIFHGILADMLHDDVKVAWVNIKENKNDT